MAVAFKNATGANNSGTTTWTVTKPAWVADGDMLILFAGSDSVHTITTAPSGFTQIQSTIGTGTDDSSLTIWWKQASSESATWDIVFGASESGATGLLGYTGHLASTAPESVAGTRPASSTLIAAPSITPSVNDCMVVAIYGADPAGAPTGTADASPAATERLDFANSALQHLYAQDFLQTTAAAVVLEATMTAADTYCTISLAIKPAVAAAATLLWQPAPPSLYSR